MVDGVLQELLVAVARVLAQQQLALVVVCAECRRIGEVPGEVVRLASKRGYALILGRGEVEARIACQPLLYLVVGVQQEREPAVVVVDGVALAVVVSQAGVVVSTVVAPAEVDVVVLREAGGVDVEVLHVVVHVDQGLLCHGVRHGSPALADELLLYVGRKSTVLVDAPDACRAFVAVGLVFVACPVGLVATERAQRDRSLLLGVEVGAPLVVQVVASVEELVWVVEVVPRQL